MLKIFALLNLAGLFLFNLLVQSPIAISQDLPAQLTPGTETRVSVTVDKGTLTGFAKLQIDLPPGCTATAIETKGASFTFAEGKAKFIWMALPSQPSFKVSYTLSVDASANGNLPVTGRFSYIEDNERKTADMTPANLSLSGQNAMADNGQAPQGNGAGTAGTSAAAPAGVGAPVNAPAEAGLAQASGTDTGMPPAQGPGYISGKRVITPVNENELLVTVTIDKGSLRGFGKLEEYLPEGFTAVAKDIDEAIFTTKGQNVKFVWLNLPAKSVLNISYRLLVGNVPEAEYEVHGDFGYLMNDLTQRYPLGATKFTAGRHVEQAVAQAPVPAPAPVPESAPAVATPAPAPVTAQASGNPAGTVTSVPAPERGITYKVQITAAHREVGHPYFIQRHHYSGDFSIERHEGWIKYVTGSFAAYRSAREQRQAYVDAKYNFPGPFVTAYNNGERITVQEALMIAGNKSAQ